jgi:hypothetical protein
LWLQARPRTFAAGDETTFSDAIICMAHLRGMESPFSPVGVELRPQIAA